MGIIAALQENMSMDTLPLSRGSAVHTTITMWQTMDWYNARNMNRIRLFISVISLEIKSRVYVYYERKMGK